jgi:hypothetical protein
MRVASLIVLLTLSQYCAFGSERTESDRVADIRNKHSAELAILAKYRKNPRDYSNGRNVLSAAQKLFAETEFIGLSRVAVVALLGPPDAALPLATYTYGDGEQFVIRRFRFDSEGHVETIEKIPSQ